KTQITEKSILVGHSMGAYLSQEFALAYPELVEKVFVIGYPIDKESKTYKDNTYLTQTIFPKRLGHHTFVLEAVKPYFAKIIGLLSSIVTPQYGKSVECFFIVPNHILTKVWKHTVMPSEIDRIAKLGSKVVIINGNYDAYNEDVVDTFPKYGQSYIIKGMSHMFFFYETIIAGIIKKHLS
ncbi:MAG: alpha/beta hydrolase, partial [Patescibacteria group bacterium]